MHDLHTVGGRCCRSVESQFDGSQQLLSQPKLVQWCGTAAFRASAQVAPEPPNYSPDFCPAAASTHLRTQSPSTGHQRVTQSTVTAEGGMNETQQAEQDVYGFPLLNLSEQQQSARATCAAYEARRRRKWQAYVQKQELPTGGTLKRYCRKVCSRADSSTPAALTTAAHGTSLLAVYIGHEAEQAVAYQQHELRVKGWCRGPGRLCGTERYMFMRKSDVCCRVFLMSCEAGYGGMLVEQQKQQLQQPGGMRSAEQQGRPCQQCAR